MAQTINILKKGDVSTSQVSLSDFLAALKNGDPQNDAIMIDGVEYILSTAEIGLAGGGYDYWGDLILTSAGSPATLQLYPTLVLKGLKNIHGNLEIFPSGATVTTVFSAPDLENVDQSVELINSSITDLLLNSLINIFGGEGLYISSNSIINLVAPALQFVNGEDGIAIIECDNLLGLYLQSLLDGTMIDVDEAAALKVISVPNYNPAPGRGGLIAQDCATLTSVDASSMTRADDEGVEFIDCPLLVQALLNALATCDGNNMYLSNCPLFIAAFPALTHIGGLFSAINIGNTTFTLPLLANTVRGYDVESNANLLHFSLPAFTGNNATATTYVIINNPLLLDISIPSQTMFGTYKALTASGNPNVTSITVNAAPDIANIDVSGNALTAAAIDVLLAALIAGGEAGGTANFTGGTNAPPDAAGLAMIATLTANGWAITHN